jgi:hypothetical protein
MGSLAKHGPHGAGALPEPLHQALRALVAEMMGTVAGTSAPGRHVSFAVIGGSGVKAGELAAMLSALFGLDLAGEAVLDAPTPDSLARTVAARWLASGGTVNELAACVRAIAEDF